MARKLLVQIVGDASSLEAALGRSGAAAEGFGSKLGGLAKVATLAAGAAGIGAVALVLDKSVKAAIAGQASQAALNTALKATHQSVSAMTPAIEKAEDASRKLGFTDEETRAALAKLEIAAGNTKKATEDLSVAQNIARFKHIDVASAAQTLSQAMTGSARAAKQLGITIIPVTAATDALKSKNDYASVAAYSHAKAVASLADKMATAKEVIAATTDKVQGQAQAFAGTAAGGMEQFHAQLEHLEEGLGNKLLPALVGVLDWLNSHWPQIDAVFQTVFAAVGRAIDFVKPYFEDFLRAVEQIIARVRQDWPQIQAVIENVIARVRQDWPQIQAVIENVMNSIRSIITGVVNIAQAIWAKFGSAITTIAQRDFATAVAVIKDAIHIIEGIFQLVADVLHGRWGAAWDDVKKIVTNALRVVVTLLKTEIENLGTIAAAIGKAILNGILHGIEGLGSALFDKLKSEVGGALSKVKSVFKIFSPSRVFADELGSPLAAGVVQGWIEGSAALPSKMSQTLQNAINAARTAIQNSRSDFQTAFSSLTSVADNAFSAIAGAKQTPAGKKLAALTAAHDAAALQQQIAAAQAGLATAQTGGDPAAILSAQQTLNDALYQQTVATLQKQDAAQQLNANAAAAVRQMNFDKALTQLETHLSKTGASTATAMKAITKLLGSYGVSFAAVGADMGQAWIQGLKETISAAAKGAGSLGSTISKAAAGISVGKAVPHLDTGGYILQSGIAMVHKGETVVPAGRGGGVTVMVPVTVHGFVGNDQDIAVKVGQAVATALRANTVPGLASAIRSA